MSATPATLSSSLTPEFQGLVKAMDRYAGSWGRQFSQLLKVSDPANRRRLLEAFPDLVQRYGPGSDFYESASAPEPSASPYPIYF
jgi:hypothetical protein